jgi:hypothetical protein
MRFFDLKKEYDAGKVLRRKSFYKNDLGVQKENERYSMFRIEDLLANDWYAVEGKPELKTIIKVCGNCENLRDLLNGGYICNKYKYYIEYKDYQVCKDWEENKNI